MVYVLNKEGKPLMPTSDHRKVRLMLKNGQAKVVKREPFTIQMVNRTHNYTQPVTLGVDAGSKHVGLCASAEKQTLYQEELLPRNDVVKHLSDRRQYRCSRRNRKTRYRQARFDNRVHSKHKGWLAPSVEVKIQEHITTIQKVCKILPVSLVRVETAEFDTQRLKAMEGGKLLPVGTDYQKGEMYDAYNARQYVLKRDDYTCQCCGKHKEGTKLHVHHIESRKTGGNAPGNLITLCEDCHKKLHAGLIRLPESKRKRNKSLRDAAFMGIMRKTLVNRLKDILDIPIQETYGYITKYKRESHGIKKTHISDAYCIANNLNAKPLETYYLTKVVRNHNRQIHKAKIYRNGHRKLNQAPYIVKGFRLFDRVGYQGSEYFVFGRRKSGFFDIRNLDGQKVNKGSVSCKKLKLIGMSSNYLTERRVAGAFLTRPVEVGVSCTKV